MCLLLRPYFFEGSLYIFVYLFIFILYRVLLHFCDQYFILYDFSGVFFLLRTLYSLPTRTRGRVFGDGCDGVNIRMAWITHDIEKIKAWPSVRRERIDFFYRLCYYVELASCDRYNCIEYCSWRRHVDCIENYIIALLSDEIKLYD